VTEKPAARHLDRKAILYIRQSTQRQLSENAESQRLQYAMQERLRSLGWREIEVIDEDLGRSAGGTTDRPGFQRLIAEVSLGRVGAVAAREVSRFSRNSRDWQQLVEICRIVETLLVDQEAIYDPRGGNDRLLLGLKGSLNEYELELLRLRGLEARRAKARRGEYIAKVPAGYCKTDDDRLEKHPDRRVREAITCYFAKLPELGSVRQVLLWLREHELQMPRNRGREVVWKPASYDYLLKLARNPVYAGTYAYGRSKVACRLDEGGGLRRVVIEKPQEEWTALISDHHEGYISEDDFERNQAMIANNAQRRWGGKGAPKSGAALLAGMLRCHRCGAKLIVSYSGSAKRIHRYMCTRANASRGEAACIGFSGPEADERVANEILEVVQPAAVAASAQAARDAAAQQDEVVRALRTELEECHYAADRAQRQYDAVDPANRLVADTLEQRWNDALLRAQQVEARILDAEAERLNCTVPCVDELNGLAEDLAKVWSGADARLKKRLLRTLAEEIIVDLDEAASEIVLVVRWRGGVHSELRVPKRRRGYNATKTPDEIVEAVRVLARVGTDEAIAQWLAKAGLRSAHGNAWTRSLVASLRHRVGIPCFTSENKETQGWLTISEAADRMGIAWKTVQRAIERGDIEAEHPLPGGPWILSEAELGKPKVLELLEKCRASKSNGRAVHSPNQLTLEIPGT